MHRATYTRGVHRCRGYYSQLPSAIRHVATAPRRALSRKSCPTLFPRGPPRGQPFLTAAAPPRSFVPSGDELTTERAERKARNRVERGDDGGTGTDAPTPPRCTNDKILISRRVYNNAHYSRNASGYPKRGLSAPWTDCSMEREVGGLGPVISGP